MAPLPPGAHRPTFRLLLFVLLAASVLLGAACSDGAQPRSRRAISVEGTAHEVIGVGVFVLTDANGAADAEVLLVLDPQRRTVWRGERVRVSGELRRFRIAEAADTLGRPVDEARLARFEGTTYVQARLIERPAGDPDNRGS